MGTGAIFATISVLCMNQLYRLFLVVCVALTAAACNRDPQTDPQPARRAAVTIDCAGAFGVDVRTFIEGQLSDGNLEIGWDEADRFRLWSCRSGDGTFATSGTDFALYHYDMTFPVARFKGEVDLSAYSAGDTYDYYAVSPAPASETDVQGTRVSYTIPAVQTGEFDGKLDILTAQLTDAPALAEGHNPDIRLEFQHRVHVLRIAIPENGMGEDIRAMELTFPSPVAGRLTVDASGASEPELTDGCNVIRLDFAEPKRVGDVIYVTIAPTTIPADGVISMRIMGRTGETSTSCLGGVARTMAAGHFSPVELRVPQMKVRYTLLTFRLPDGLGVNTLGEAVNKVKITPSDGSLAGATLPDNSVLTSAELTYGVSSTDGRDYSVILMPDVADGIIAGLNGKALTVELESPRAWGMSQVLAGRNIALNAETVYEISVPYLLDIDLTGFSGSDGHDNPGYGVAVETNISASDLGEKINAKLAGWSGVNVGVESGAIRTNCRFEDASLFITNTNRYRGRIDTAPLSRIRSTAKVRVNLEYTGAKGGASAVNPVAAYGYTTDQSAKINSKNDSGTGWLSTGAQQFPNLPTNGSFTSGFVPFEYTIADCTPQHRLTWEVNSTGTAKRNNANSWLYIRNIKVSLANE